MNTNITERKKRIRDAMAPFAEDQLSQIVLWIGEKVPLIDIAKLCREQFQIQVSASTLSRWNSDRQAVELQESDEHLAQIASEVNHYAVTGEAGLDGAGFHSATLHLIEKQTFQLALHMDGTIGTDDQHTKAAREDHRRFKDLFRMKLAHENSQIKKALAGINVRKLALAERKQTHREHTAEQKRLDREKRHPKNTGGNSSRSEQVQSNPAGTLPAADTGSPLSQTPEIRIYNHVSPGVTPFEGVSAQPFTLNPQLAELEEPGRQYTDLAQAAR